jgi:PPP family 3-phenylpropionic acid transporter
MYLILTYIVLFFIYGVIPPYLPILVRDLGYSTSIVGIILAVSEGAGIFGPFVFGHFADKSRKYKPGIILSFILTALGAIPLALFVHPLASAFFIAILALGYRSSLPLVESMATLNLAKGGNYGKLRMTGSISFICVVFFLQWTPVLKPNTSFNIAALIVIAVFIALITVLLLPRRITTFSSPQPSEQPRPEQQLETKTVLPSGRNLPLPGRAIWTPYFIMGFTIIFLSRLAMAPVNSFLSLYLVEYLHWDVVGYMWALASIAEIPFMFISSRLIRRFGTMTVLAFTSLVVGVRLLLYVFFPIHAGIITAQLLHSFCFGLFHPAAVLFIAECVPPEKRAYGMTLYLSLGLGLPTFIGNFIGGFIVDHRGYPALFGSFVVFALIAALIFPLYKIKKLIRKEA